MLILLQIDPN